MNKILRILAIPDMWKTMYPMYRREPCYTFFAACWHTIGAIWILLTDD